MKLATLIERTDNKTRFTILNHKSLAYVYIGDVPLVCTTAATIKTSNEVLNRKVKNIKATGDGFMDITVWGQFENE